MKLWLGRSALSVLAVICLASCDNSGPIGLRWPLAVNFATNDASIRSVVRPSIDDLNQAADRKLIDLEATSGYTLVFSWFETHDSSDPRAGLAEIQGHQCQIQLSTKLLTSAYRSYVNSVVWHEIGHCVTLPHVGNSNDIMFKDSRPFTAYNVDAIHRFFSAMYRSVP